MQNIAKYHVIRGGEASCYKFLREMMRVDVNSTFAFFLKRVISDFGNSAFQNEDS
jgi:hypothetical protein